MTSTKKVVAKEVVLTTTAKAATAVFAIVISLVITRLSGKEAFGIISLSNQLLGFFIIVIIGGHYQHITRYIARSRLSVHSLHQIQNTLRTTISKRTLAVAPIALLVAIGVFIVQNKNIGGLIAFALMTVGLLFQVLSRINASILLGLRKVWQSSWAENTLVNFIVCVSLIAVYLAKGTVSIITIAIIYVSARIITYVLINTYLNSTLNTRVEQKRYSNEEDLNPEELEPNRSFAIISLTAYAYTITSGIVLGLFGDLNGVGEYNILLKICSPLLFITSAIQRSYNPRIAKAYKGRNITYLKKSFVEFAAAATIIFMLYAALILSLQTEILALWEIDSPDMYNVLLILLMGHGVNIICANAGQILAMTQFEALHARLNIVGITLNIVLTITLVHFYGFYGAAWSFVINTTIVNGAKIWIMIKKVYPSNG